MKEKRGRREYSLEIKKQAVKMCIEEGRTKKEVMDKYHIKNDTQIETWCRKYKELGEIGLLSKKQQDEFNVIGEPLWKKIQRLEMENELLKKYHTETGRWFHPKLPTESLKK
jgi:transposase-like protein